MPDPITMSESDTINLTAKEQASHESSQELIRNAMHRVASDGSEDINALQYLAGIASNTLLLGANPHKSQVVVHNTTARQTLIPACPNTRIRIFDILLSINAAGNISFYPDDKSVTPIFPRMFAPNPGQGFSFNSIRGYPLPRGSGLCVVASAAIDYAIGVSYAEEPNEEK